MKLIKINTDHYIVVDDSEIKEGDWIIDIKRPLSPRQIKTKHLLEDLFDSEKKITHSTLPLDSVAIENSERSYKLIPLAYIKVVVSEVDIDKKAKEEGGYDVFRDRIIYSHGYNQALEDNKEKKYTEEDIRKAILMARVRIENVSPKYSIDEIIQAIKPKTEWEVEIIDDKLKLK